MFMNTFEQNLIRDILEIQQIVFRDILDIFKRLSKITQSDFTSFSS